MNRQGSIDTLPLAAFPLSMPSANHPTFHGFSREEIQAWTLRKSHEYHLLSYNMLSLHNATAPLHMLPTEILMKVLGQTWVDHQSLHLTSVYRQWRSVYLSMPEFWARAMSSLCFVRDKILIASGRSRVVPQDFVATLLDRSSPHPIQLDIEHAHGVLPASLSVHLYRVTSLQLSTTLLHLNDLYHALNTGMPTLEALEVQATVWGESMEPTPLALTRTFASSPVSDDSLPRLHFVDVTPPAFFALVAVKSLIRAYLGCSEDPGVNGDAFWDSQLLLRALNNCRSLEVLHFEQFSIPRSWLPLDESRIADLPSMKRLFIGR